MKQLLLLPTKHPLQKLPIPPELLEKDKPLNHPMMLQDLRLRMSLRPMLMIHKTQPEPSPTKLINLLLLTPPPRLSSRPLIKMAKSPKISKFLMPTQSPFINTQSSPAQMETLKPMSKRPMMAPLLAQSFMSMPQKEIMEITPRLLPPMIRMERPLEPQRQHTTLKQPRLKVTSPPNL